MFHIVLLEPEIPANTGNIGRTCLCTNSHLHLIEPMGFILNDKNLKRAGMDYWKDVQVTVYDCWEDFVEKNKDRVQIPSVPGEGKADSGEAANIGKTAPCEGKARLWMATTKAQKTHDQAEFKDGDYIMFGKESAGIPEELLMQDKEACIRIPMASEQRSLNLSNSVAVVLYEALRQNQYLDLTIEGQLHHHTW